MSDGHETILTCGIDIGIVQKGDSYGKAPAVTDTIKEKCVLPASLPSPFMPRVTQGYDLTVEEASFVDISMVGETNFSTQ